MRSLQTRQRETALIRQAAVVCLSMLPFGASSIAAFIVWGLVDPLATVWRMVIIFFVWIGVFAAFTQLFWKVVGLLATEP